MNIILTMHEVLPTGHTRCGHRQMPTPRSVPVDRVPCRDCARLHKERDDMLRPQFNKTAGQYTRGLITFDEMAAEIATLRAVNP